MRPRQVSLRSWPVRLTRARAREQILQLCEGGADARTLRLEVLGVLRRAIGFDAYVWLVTDPETSVGSAPLADVPCLPELPRLIQLKYLTTVNRWTSMITPVASLHQATGGDLARSLIWRDLLSRYQVGDIATSVYRDRFGCWAFLDLWRMQNAPPFTAAELEFLHSIAGPLTAALRHAQAAAFAAAPAGVQPSTGPVVLLLSPALEVRAQTPQTQQLPAAARPAGHRGAGTGPGRRLQRGRAAARPGSRRRRQPAARPGPPGQRPLADPARRPDGIGPAGTRARHRRQHRDNRLRRAPLAVHPGLRAEFPRVRAAGPRHGRARPPGTSPS